MIEAHTHNPILIILDIAAGLITLGILIALAYEVVALVNLAIPFTPNLPTITSIVRPLIMEHKMTAIIITLFIAAAFAWLIYHFFIQIKGG